MTRCRIPRLPKCPAERTQKHPCQAISFALCGAAFLDVQCAGLSRKVRDSNTEASDLRLATFGGRSNSDQLLECWETVNFASPASTVIWCSIVIWWISRDVASYQSHHACKEFVVKVSGQMRPAKYETVMYWLAWATALRCFKTHRKVMSRNFALQRP